MYFGVLRMKGYVPIGIAFGFSGAFIRFRIAAGNTLALVYETNPSFALEATTPRQSSSSASSPRSSSRSSARSATSPSSWRHRIASGAAHQGTGERVLPFRPRDGDRHAHCARLHDGQRGKKLVISPYTVNTHVRHVYEKIGIHKRSELIDYINGNGSSESGN